MLVLSRYCPLETNLKTHSEPEFRLVHLPWCAAFLGGGLFLYGYFISIGASGPLCAFWFGFQKVGLIMGTVGVMSYALDAFRSSSTEIFIMGMVFKVSAAESFCKIPVSRARS